MKDKTMKQLRSTISLFTGLALLGAPIIAATPEQLQQAERFLASDKSIQALELLEAVHNPQTANIQELFLLGMSAKLSGSLSKAERYLRSALSRQPEAGRIRLELAEVLFRQGKFDDSHIELATVREMNPPEQVLQNVNLFIAEVEAAKADPNHGDQKPKKNWSAYITAGLISDNNVNAGPDTDTVLMYGLPFTLSTTAQKTKDTAIFLRMGLNYQAQTDNGIIWRNNVNIGFTRYTESKAYNTTNLNLSFGPDFSLGERGVTSFPVTYEVQRYDEQGSWNSQSWGIAPRFQYALHDNVQWYLDASISRKRFNDTNNRDLTAYTLNPSMNFKPYDNGNFTVGLQYGREESGLNIYSNTVRGAYIGYQHIFREQGVQVSVTTSFTDSKFDGIQAAYTVPRHDVSRKISANVSYAIPQLQNMTLQGSVSYQDNDSNLDINNYNRSQFSLSITKSF